MAVDSGEVACAIAYNQAQARWYSLLTNSYGTGGDVVTLIMLWKMIDLCEEIDALPRDCKCVTEKVGGDPWISKSKAALTKICSHLFGGQFGE